MLGWLSISLVTSLVPLLLGHRLLRRAAPSRETFDFSSAGERTHWDVDKLGRLMGPVGSFVREVRAEPSVAFRIDLICERLADVDLETRRIPERLALLARTALACGGLVTILMVVEAIHAGSAWLAAWGLVPMVFSSLTAFRCHWMGRVANYAVDVRRRHWDALSGLLVRPHMFGNRFAGGDPNSSQNDGSCAAAQRGAASDGQAAFEGQP